MSLVSEQWLRSHMELDMSPDSPFRCMISGKVFNLSGPWFIQLQIGAVVGPTTGSSYEYEN